MEQRAIVIMMMFLVLFGMGGFIVYDVTVNDRLGQITGKEEQKSNWKWDDNWNPDGSVIPESEEPIVDTPPQVEQIVARDYQDALKKSGEKGMPIFAYFEADYCHWCKKMKSEVLTDGQVQAMMKNYIIVNIDAQKERSTLRKFGISGLPSYVITNVNEKNLKKGQGYMSTDKFVHWLNNPELYNQPKTQPRNDRRDPRDNDDRWPRFPRDRDDRNQRNPG